VNVEGVLPQAAGLHGAKTRPHRRRKRLFRQLSNFEKDEAACSDGSCHRPRCFMVTPREASETIAIPST